MYVDHSLLKYTIRLPRYKKNSKNMKLYSIRRSKNVIYMSIHINKRDSFAIYFRQTMICVISWKKDPVVEIRDHALEVPSYPILNYSIQPFNPQPLFSIFLMCSSNKELRNIFNWVRVVLGINKVA